MRFFIDEVEVIFPYEMLYPEQIDYMIEMKRGLDKGGHLVLEMPSGTGKTVCLLSLLIAYTQHHVADRRKIVYCTRTVSEMSKTIDELKKLWGDWLENPDIIKKKEFLGFCLTSKSNLCVESSVSVIRNVGALESACYSKIAHWNDRHRCGFYDITVPKGSSIEDIETGGIDHSDVPRKTITVLPSGIYSVDDLKSYGHQHGYCPYFLTRASLANADIIVNSFLYIVDPKIHGVLENVTNAGTIVVMDEGHNVDDNTIEAMSMVLTKNDIQSAKEHAIPELRAAIEKSKEMHKERLQQEYDKLVSGLALMQMTSGRRGGWRGLLGRGRYPDGSTVGKPGEKYTRENGGRGPGYNENSGTAGDGNQDDTSDNDGGLRVPQELLEGLTNHSMTLPDSISQEAIPSVLRNSGTFANLLSTLVDFLQKIIRRVRQTYIVDPLTFLARVREECHIDVRHLHYAGRRLMLLLYTLRVTEKYKFRQLVYITIMFETLLTNFSDDRHPQPSFVVIVEPNDPANPLIHDPIIRLACCDPSVAVHDIFEKYKTVILTSGTLSPLNIYPKILGFKPEVMRSFQMTLSRKCLAPCIVTRASDVMTGEAWGDTVERGSRQFTESLSSSMVTRINPEAQASVIKSYGDLLLGLAETVPDGIVCFFTGYQYMSEVMLAWHASGVIKKLAERKLIFVETQGIEETQKAVVHYRKACDMGRGAIFMSIARGKIAEGIDFEHHYGRAVVMFGVPFLPPIDEPLKQRMHWMDRCLGISEVEYRNFDAIRQASQCMGRVFRNKRDYGMMIMVDKRYALADLRSKLPNWVQQHLKTNLNLSVEATVSVAKDFFREMAQPWDMQKGLGLTLYDANALARMGYMTPAANVTIDEGEIEGSQDLVEEGDLQAVLFGGLPELVAAEDADKGIHAIPSYFAEFPEVKRMRKE